MLLSHQPQQPQQEPEHHRLLDIHHSPHDHDGSSSSFVGQSDLLSPTTSSNNNVNVSHQPISTRKHSKRTQDRTTQPSLWNTKEFYFYYLVFAFCVPYMFKTAHDASSGTRTLKTQAFYFPSLGQKTISRRAKKKINPNHASSDTPFYTLE
jgi:hypothetical protein